MPHFNRLNQQIETASRKFLADIEAWRKLHFHKLKKIVDDYGLEEPEEWINKLKQWALNCSLWPDEGDPKHRLKRGAQHWQTRAFMWTSRLKADLVKLIHERTTLTRQRLELYTKLDLRYSSSLPDLVDKVQTLNLELHHIVIDDINKYHKAISLRESIDVFINQITDEIATTEKPLDLLLSDQTKSDFTSKLLKLRNEIDENLSSLSLIKRYLDWAAQEPYVAEVIRYLDKADAILTHTTNQIRKQNK